jgi:hypothetical protein
MNSCPTFCSSLIEESVWIAQLAGAGSAVGSGVLVGAALAVGSAAGVGVTVGAAIGAAVGELALTGGLGVEVGTGHAVPLIGGTDGRGALTAAWPSGCEQALQTSTNDNARRRG